jgi:pimeloyl-ACP methyl ester carboxylesterase
VTAPRLLYLHGFASGPRSTKGVAFAEHLARRGVAVDRLDLRVPSLEHLRLSRMIDAVQAAIGSPRDRAVVVGSSLGGLTAARVAERDPRVSGLILLAPAFRMIERWARRLGDEAWQAWRQSGWLAIDDYAERRPARVDFGFAEDGAAVDAEGGGWPDVRVPTLILHGRNDEVVDIELSREIVRGRPWMRLIELDDGHELVASLPTILAEADAFLAPWLGAPPPPAG